MKKWNKTVLYSCANKHFNYSFTLIYGNYINHVTFTNRQNEERSLNNLIANERDCIVRGVCMLFVCVISCLPCFKG